MNLLHKITLAVLIVASTLNPFKSHAADHVTMTLLNPTSTANTLEFDVYIVNDDTSILNLGGYQFGINFSSSIMNGGTPATTAYTYIAGTRDASFAALTNPSVIYTSSTSHLRVTSTTVPSVNAVPLPFGVQRRLGRFRFTNTVNWTVSSLPNLQFQLPSQGGKTHCMAVCFVNGANLSTPLSNPTATLDGVIGFSGLTLNSPLPVHLTSFNGIKSGNSDILSWTTSQEENNAYFNLQHSNDGIDFRTIQKVISASEKGNSAITLNYTAKNPSPVSGHNYYRLVQVDIDGHTTIETAIVDLFRSANGQTVTLYPNPTVDMLHLDYEAEARQNTLIKIIDLNGRVVKHIVSVSRTGSNTDTIDIKDLVAGQYVIQLYTNEALIFTSAFQKNN